MKGRNTLNLCTAAMVEAMEQYLTAKLHLADGERVSVKGVKESGTRMAGMTDGFTIDFEVVTQP